MCSLCFPRFPYVFSMSSLCFFSLLSLCFLCVFRAFFSTFSLSKSMLSLCVLYVSSMLSLRFSMFSPCFLFAFPCDLTREPRRATSSWKIIDRRSFGQVTSSCEPLLKLFTVCTICIHVYRFWAASNESIEGILIILSLCALVTL